MFLQPCFLLFCFCSFFAFAGWPSSTLHTHGLTMQERWFWNTCDGASSVWVFWTAFHVVDRFCFVWFCLLVFVHASLISFSGDNTYPLDPWRRPLDKKRLSVAGTKIVPGYICILDGMQADQDYLRAVFSLQRYVTRQECCHLCAGQVLQWTSNRPGEPNDPNRLFTVFGPSEDTGIISVQEFQRVNGLTPLTLIPGFHPSRLYPDIMHIVHLALIQDVCCSVLLDLSDNHSMIQGRTRDNKLLTLWSDYRAWCEAQHVGSRASRRLFTTSILRPGPNKFPEPSQKIMNATAARFFLFWVSVT